MKRPLLHILQQGPSDVSHETFWSATPLCALLNFEALLQLTAGGINIIAARITDRGLDATRLKAALKILNLMNRRRLERAALDVVKLNQVNVAQRSLAEVAECLHLGIRIVDAFDHGILIGRAAASLLGVELKRLVQAEQRVLLNTGHKLIARRLDGGMQRHGKRELLGDVGKFANSRNNAAGRDGEVTGADTDAIGVVEDTQCLENLVVVGKRLALAHEHNARGTLAKVVGYMKRLVDDLLSCQRALEAVKAGGAKGTAHATACLGGNADGKLVTTGHTDSLDGNAVVVLEQILARAIFGNLLGELGRRVKGKSLFKLLAESLGKVSHIIKRTNVLLKDPFDELLRAEGGLAEFCHELANIVLAQVANVLRFSPGIHGSLSILGKRRGYRYNMVSAAEIIEEESAHAG